MGKTIVQEAGQGMMTDQCARGPRDLDESRLKGVRKWAVGPGEGVVERKSWRCCLGESERRPDYSP